jgi:hypothetical protein
MLCQHEKQHPAYTRTSRTLWDARSTRDTRTQTRNAKQHVESVSRSMAYQRRAITTDLCMEQVFFPFIFGSSDEWLGRGHTKETGNRNFREFLSACVEHLELNWAPQFDETATQLAEVWETQLPGNWATSLLTVALQRSFLVSAVLTCFCDSFVPFDSTKG